MQREKGNFKFHRKAQERSQLRKSKKQNTEEIKFKQVQEIIVKEIILSDTCENEIKIYRTLKL